MVWWLGNCDYNHEWQGRITHIQKGQGKCVVCVGRKIERGFNDLSTTHPQIAAEWHPALNDDLTPEKATQGSSKKIWWLGECGHEWDATISSRATHGTGCAVCSGKKVLPGYNDLATTRPEIAAQWHPTLNGALTPQQVPRGTTKKVWWVCSKGHEWEAQINDRNSGNGCPVCANKQILPGFNDLATAHPNLAAQWHPTKNEELTVEMVTAGSSVNVWWQCSKGHEWQAQINDRNSGNGCPVCANKQIHVGYNDLASTHPHAAALWHPTLNGDLTPRMVTASNGTTVWWLGNCGRGHEWQSRIVYMGKGQEKCLVCIGQRIQTGYNDLATTRPELAAQWHPTKNGDLTPHMVMPGSSKRVWWQCTRGHEWSTTIKNRSAKGTGCPVCSNNVILAGYNDLATTHPATAALWHPTLNENLTPMNITAGSQKKVWWLENCGHEWFSRIRSHVKGSGCPTCAAGATISHGEQEIADYVMSLGVHVIQSDNSQIHKELDLYLPEEHIAIEHNGLYYHSEAKGIKAKYHREKWLRCKNKGIQLLQIWEDEWLNKPELVKRLLADKLGAPKESLVQAQQTFIATITPQEAQTFLEETHLQGQANGNHYLGLRSKETNKLVTIMVLVKRANPTGLTLEIVRYATSCRVPGGFTKLLKHVTTIFQPTQITVFDDHCISDSDLYVHHGFTAEKELAPDYWYFVRNQRVNKTEYSLEHFRTDPNLQWDPNLTETQLAQLNSLHRIYDAGKTRWTKTFTHKNEFAEQ